jgi:single-stranded DNA-binding protein
VNFRFFFCTFLASGEQIFQKYEDKEVLLIKVDMWTNLGNMTIDSVQAGAPHYVRSGA